MDGHINMQSVFTGDPILAGRYFFARIDNAQPPTPNSWSLVMVVTPDLAPQCMLDGEEKALRITKCRKVHPCWLIGLARL